MRRLKAIFLIPVFIVLLIGVAIAAYYLMLVPQMDKVKKAVTDWKTSRDAELAEEPKWQQHCDSQLTSAKKIFEDSYYFGQIQSQMPAIYDMKDFYAKNPRQGLVAWYQIMATGRLANELTRWANRFHLDMSKVEKFRYEGKLGYEEVLPAIKFVEVDFGEQQFVANGYPALLNKVQNQTGHGFFPLIITPSGDKISVTVDRSVRYNPKAPRLRMPFTAKAYFMTQGWDPNGGEMLQAREDAKAIILNPPKPDPPMPQPEPPPKLLWIADPPGFDNKY